MELPRISRLYVLCQLVLSLATIGSRSQYASDDDEQRPISMKLSDESCIFPSRWEGNWFQSGVASIISINHTSIASKGRCVEADGDKYIVYSQSEECYRCVVFHEKHLNVLQYKETFCYPDPSAISLRSLCRRIPGDAHLYSMFRLDADPMPCPFQGSFTFTYSRGQGVCHSPVSTIDTCNLPSQLVLNYQACYDVPGTESRVEELECIAQWKEGSSRYMVALLKYLHDPSSYEERFRCFAYEPWNQYSSNADTSPYAQSYTFRRPSNASSATASGRFVEDAASAGDKVIFRVAQSGDATCLGLTPVEGSRTLTLRRAVPVQSPCTFPNWLQVHAQWLTLDGGLSYAFKDRTLTITNNSVLLRDSDDQATSLVTTAICIKKQPSASEDQSFVLRVTSGCQIGYICLRAFKRDHHILELQMSKLSRDADSACSSFDAESTFGSTPTFITLTSPTPEMRECPYIGRFDITDMSELRGKRCRQELKGSLLMGCGGLDTVYLNKFCPNFPKVLEEYRCNGWWEEASGDTFLVVSSMQGSARHCFQIQEKVLEGPPQGLKRKDAYVATFEEDEIGQQRRSQKVFHFVKFGSNCQRNLDLKYNPLQVASAFNTTNFSHCENDSSGSSNRARAKFVVKLSIFILFQMRTAFLQI